jgi:hypothetical protein
MKYDPQTRNTAWSKIPLGTFPASVDPITRTGDHGRVIS